MGAYLYFKLENKSLAKDVNDFLEESVLNQELKDEGIYFTEPRDVQYAKKHNPAIVDYYKRNLGKGDVKVSAIDCRCTHLSPEEVIELQTQVFEELNKLFRIKYYSGSCAFTKEEHYYSIEQMKRITKNGELLSGKSSKDEETLKKYNELLELVRGDIFDVSILKKNDEVLLDDGHIYTIRDDSYRHIGLCAVQNDAQYITHGLGEITDKIVEYIKYVPRCRFSGSNADVEAYITDQNILVYFEISGQEHMVKAITSVLMQGRTIMNKWNVDVPAIGNFNINKAGNKRKLIDLGDGLAHAIVYHAPSIEQQGFNILVAENEDRLFEQFKQWMNKSQPLPYPKEVEKYIYEEMESQGFLKQLATHNINAMKIDKEILNEDAKALQDIILSVSRKHGLISVDAIPMKQKAELPISPILTVGQVEKVYETLEKMPKTYETEELEIKPIGLKLFTSGMTWYVIEANKGCESDEEVGLHPQAFGYVYNDSFPGGSEYGYINIEEVIRNGAEMDLYFEDMYIKDKQIGTVEELQKNIS